MFIGGAILGAGLLGAYGSMSAAGTQASAQGQAAATQQQMFNTINQQQQPFIQAGYGATTSLSNLLGTSGKSGTTDPSTGLPQGYLTQTFNPTQQQLEQYPGYQFALNQGEQSVLSADAPAVGAMSGAAMKDLTNFATNTANTNYGNYFNQFQQQQNNIFSRLSGLTSLGQNAAANVGNSGTQLGTGIAQAQAAAGGAQAGGIVGATNSLAGSLPLYAMLSGSGGGGVNPANTMSATEYNI